MRSGVAVVVGLVALDVIAGCATRPAGHPAAPVTSAAPAPAPERLVMRLGVEPKTVDAAAPGGVTIRYELTRPAAVVVDLVDEAGRVVRALDAGTQPPGVQSARWDGRTAEGAPISDGAYRYIIHARDAQGREQVDDPSTTTGGMELTPRDFSFDRAAGTFRWVMPQAGYARLRVGIEGFPHLRTLIDWVPLEAGPQMVSWDGRDASGLVQLADHPRLTIKLFAFALPDNVVIVRGPAAPAPPEAPPSVALTYPPLVWGSTAALHAQHPRATCHESRVRVEFPEGIRQDADGRPVLAGRVPVRVVLDPRDAQAVVSARFEVSLYEDLTFLMEEEDGSNPFTYLWDTTTLPPGPHLFTVNILSYDDHYGVVTQPVMIERAR